MEPTKQPGFLDEHILKKFESPLFEMNIGNKIFDHNLLYQLANQCFRTGTHKNLFGLDTRKLDPPFWELCVEKNFS